MTPIPLTPKVIFTNDLFIVSAFEESRIFGDFDKIATKTASERNSIYLSTTNDNILSLEFNLIGATTDSKGPNITLDILDPTDEFEELVFSRRVSQIPVNSHFYLAFGTDSKFVNWSNILKVTLIHAELFNNFDQAKTIRLHLFTAVRIDTLNIDVFNGYTKDVKEFGDSLQVRVEPKVLRTYNEEKLIKLQQDRIKAITNIVQTQDLAGPLKDYKIINSKIDAQRLTTARLRKSIEEYEQEIQRVNSERNEAARVLDRWRGGYNSPEYLKAVAEFQRINDKLTEINRNIFGLQDQLRREVKILSRLVSEREDILTRAPGSDEEEFRIEVERALLKASKAVADVVNIYNFPEYEKELLKVFKGYSSFDVCFKEIINKLLNSLYSDEVTCLFLIQDTEKILYENSKTKALILTFKEALAQSVTFQVTQNKKNRYIEETTVLAPTYTTVVNFSDDNLKNYKKYLEKTVKSLIPSYLDIKIVDATEEFRAEARRVLGIGESPGDEETYTDAIVDFLKELVSPEAEPVLYQEFYENKTEQELRMSINIPRRQGETDDSFRVKITDFFLNLERGLSIVDRDGFQDNLVLFAESDVKIINNFYDFLDKTDIGKQLIKEFNIRKNKPLVILGQYTVIRALLYGEEYLNTKTSIVNDLAKDYFTKLVTPKLKDKAFNMYGEQNNLLSNLEKLLASNNIQNQEFINNAKNITDDLFIFKYNIENPNVLSIKVDDYKAYTRYLLVTNTDPTNLRQVSGLDIFTDVKVSDLIKEQLARTLEFPIQDKLNNFIDYLLNNTDFKQTKLYTGLVVESIKQQNALFTKTLPLAKDYKALIERSYDLYDKNEEYLKFAFAFSRDTSLQYEQMYRGLQVARFRVTIKTLPLFFVSNYGYFRKNCLLLAKRVNLINTKSRLDNVVTGGYEIIGIKHRITSNSAESEFILQRLK